MQTNQEARSALERRIEMTVSMADIEKEVDARLKRMARTIKMPGFRPGKVPMKIVAQAHGAQARSEAIGAAVEKAFGGAVREQGLRVAGFPKIEPKESANPAEALEFVASFEVYPEVAVGDLSTQKIERPVLEVGEAEVDKTIEVLRKQRTTFAGAERAAAEGDRVVIDFTGRKDGEVFDGGQGQDFPFVIGAGSMLKDFEAAVVGLKEGDVKTFDMTFPEDYHAKHLAGQAVQFEITVKKVEAPVLPEVNADFAKALGVADKLPLAFGDLCMHEFVLSGSPMKKDLGIKTLDLAKRLLDHGYHPPTVYFPLIVHGALMIEPTESESLEGLDRFVDALLAIAEEAREDPELVRSAPHHTRRTRLDETRAARQPVLRWQPAS